MNLGIDELKLYFGDNFIINDTLSIRHPVIDDIITLGENNYFSTVHTLCAIPSDMKSQLWDMGILWEELEDFELFAMLIKTLSIENTRIFFGNIDFSNFTLGVNPQNNELILYQVVDSTENNPTGVILIDRLIYLKIVAFLRTIHSIKPKIERSGGSKTVQKILIDEDRRNKAKIKDENYHSQLLPLVSSLINCSEFSYGLNEVRQMPIYAFMDSVARVQIIKSSTALLQGCYSGMLDTSKIDKTELNWMREIKKD